MAADRAICRANVENPLTIQVQCRHCCPSDCSCADNPKPIARPNEMILPIVVSRVVKEYFFRGNRVHCLCPASLLTVAMKAGKSEVFQTVCSAFGSGITWSIVNGTYCQRSEVWQYSHNSAARWRTACRVADRILPPSAIKRSRVFLTASDSAQRDSRNSGNRPFLHTCPVRFLRQLSIWLRVVYAIILQFDPGWFGMP